MYFFFFSITVVHHEFQLINMTHGIILKKLIKCSGVGFSTSKRFGLCEATGPSLSQVWAGRGALFMRCIVTRVSVSVILNVCGGTGPHRESLWTGPGSGETRKQSGHEADGGERCPGAPWRVLLQTRTPHRGGLF